MAIGTTLIYNGQRDPLSEGPSYLKVVILSHHHVHKDGHKPASSITYAIEVYPQAKFVTIAISFDGTGEDSSCASIGINMAMLVNLSDLCYEKCISCMHSLCGFLGLGPT